MKKEDVLEITKKEAGIKTVLLQFLNIDGMLQSIEMPTSQIDDILDGKVMIDGSSIKGYSDIATSDLFLKPDLDTFMEVKFLDDGGYGRIARVICSIIDKEGKPFAGDPRAILKKVEKKYAKEGISLTSAYEAEFFLLKKDSDGNLVPADNTGYFGVAPLDTADGIKREIAKTLEQHDFEIEAFHKEVAQGQHEINYKYDTALKTADRMITFKWITRVIAAKHDLVATFMPKPFVGINGSGMHCNVSIFKDSKNMFESNNGKISSIHKKFMSGLIRRAKEIAAITNPTVNSYKRLIPGYEAPNCIAWSDSNRSAMIRVPASKGAATRVELRNVDPTANPYLAFALVFESGMEGVNSSASTFEPVYENLFKFTRKQLEDAKIELLPDSLGAALAISSKSKFVKKVLGEHTFTKFFKLKYDEWDEYRKIVHTWEMEKYLNY